MVTYSSYNSLGSSIETGEITDKAVTITKLADDMLKWNYIETLTFNNDNSKTSNTLPAYDEYMIRFELFSAGANVDLRLRLNGNSGNIYRYRIANVTSGFATVTSNSYMLIAQTDDTSVRPPAFGVLFINGKTPADSGGCFGVCGCINAGYGDAITRLDFGLANFGSEVQLTSITLYASSGSYTGKVEIFGRNRL